MLKPVPYKPGEYDITLEKWKEILVPTYETAMGKPPGLLRRVICLIGLHWWITKGQNDRFCPRMQFCWYCNKRRVLRPL